MKQKASSAFPDQGLQFLHSLKRNNNRDWFHSHKSTYEQYVKQPMTELIAALEHDRFRKIFGSLGGDRLQRVPQGFPVDHVAADYLKYKQFLAARTFPPRVATTPRFYKLVLETFQAILPLVRFLNDPILRTRRLKKRQEAFLNLGADV